MSDSSENPLLAGDGLPAFSRILPRHAVPALDAVLAENRRRIEALAAATGTASFESVVQPVEELEERLSRVWSPVGHLHAVADSPALREAYHACLPKLSEYATEMGQNEALFAAYRQVADSPAFSRLERAQRKVVENALRDFRLAGVDLPPERKERFKAAARRLSDLGAKFEENVLDATQAWKKHVRDETALAGLPPSALELMRANAAREGLDGWLLTLEFPSYFPVITYADDEQLRREAYEAYTTRASCQGPHAGRWDNGAVMDEMLALRHEQAVLLGFANFAEYSLARKMAPSPAKVMEFLTDLARRARPVAQRELEELRAFALHEHGKRDLDAWDVAYYSEKLRQAKHAVSQEELRPYFPVPRVLDGLFEITHRLYGLRVRPVEGVDAWHPDVTFYRIEDDAGDPRGEFYLDLYARPHKRGGAWMDECRVRKRTNGVVQTPVAYLTCNFTPPVGERPSLLTHDEVTTLFHEFGHGLHHMLTRVDYPSVSGINGVAWDAVELPSQFMENWCWERDALALFTAHVDTGEPLPERLYERMRGARNFQSGMQMLRQLEFALFDFRLHLEHDSGRGARVQEILDEVRRDVAVLVPPAFNRFAHAFTHIFGGGYAAGYYSYKWAEVLSSDAYSAFEENGIFDRETGLRFLHAVLERGGSADAMDLFVEFRGREPRIDALLRHCGIVEPSGAEGSLA